MMALSCVAVLWYFWEEWALKWSGSQVKSFCISLDQTQNRVSKICLMTKWEENELPMCYQKQSWELQNLSLLSLCNEIFANSHARRSVTREVWDQIRRGSAVRSTYWQISGLSPSDSWKEHALTRVKQAKWSDILHTLWVNECLWDLSLFEPLTPPPPQPHMQSFFTYYYYYCYYYFGNKVREFFSLNSFYLKTLSWFLVLEFMSNFGVFWDSCRYNIITLTILNFLLNDENRGLWMTEWEWPHSHKSRTIINYC